MLQVSLVDDHDMVREGFAELINQKANAKVIFQASSIEQQIDWLSSNPVDIIVTDLSLKNGTGYQLLEHIQQHNLSILTIVLSMHDTESHVKKALELGANAYLTKSSAPEELLLAIEKVSLGQTFLSADVIENFNSAKSDEHLLALKNLSERESEIFRELALGRAIKHVARDLDIAVKTVHVHRSNILKKLSALSNFELTKLALKYGVIGINEICS